MEDLSNLFARSVTNPFNVEAAPPDPVEPAPLETAPALPEVTSRSLIKRGGGWAGRTEIP